MVNRLARYAQIASILSKYGFGIFLDELFPEESRPEFLQRGDEYEHLSVYTRIRMAIEELGPTFIKLGQIMSTRRDILPQPMIKELQKLTDKVKPEPFEKVKSVLEETCGPLKEICRYVEEEPFAAASLSQVHRAVLLDGSEVVFKVQRPDIEELIEVDLTILESVARRVESTFPYLAPYNPVEIVKQFSTQIRKELDFVRDGKNAETLAKNLEEFKRIRLPKIYWEKTGTRLLVMKYIEGMRIDAISELERKFKLPELAELGFQAYLKQIFEDGFFHGDPHAGNLLVTDEGKLVFLDFGLIGILRPERRLTFTRVLYGIVENDVDLVVRSLRDLGVSFEFTNLDEFKDELYVILRESRRYDLKEYSFIDSLDDITYTFYRHKVKLPGTLMLMLKVLTMVGDIGILLDPEFNFIERVRPYLSKILVQNYLSPEQLERIRTTLTRDIMDLPRIIGDFIEDLSKGRARHRVDIPELEKLENSIEKASVRLFSGLLLCAIIMGLAIIITNVATSWPDWYFYSLTILGLILVILIVHRS